MTNDPLKDIPLRAQVGHVLKYGSADADSISPPMVLGMIAAKDALADEWVENGCITDEAREIVEDVLETNRS